MSKYEVDGPEESFTREESTRAEDKNFPYLSLIYEGLTGKDFFSNFAKENEGKRNTYDSIATACLRKTEAMVEKAETEMRAFFDKEARDIKARLDNAVDKGGKAIAESEELTRINVEANALLTEHANTIRSQAAEIEELKAQLEASNDLAVKAEVELRELLEKEQWARKKDVQTYVDAINNQGTIIGERDRTIASMQLAQNMAMQQVERLESKLTEAGHSRRALCETIETLAHVIRNT